MARCETCNGLPADRNHPDWPADWKPEGPDHVPPGFCNGICGAMGEIGPPGIVNTPPPLAVGMFGISIWREDQDIICPSYCWVASYGCWMHVTDSLIGLLWSLLREWKSDRHLVG